MDPLAFIVVVLLPQAFVYCQAQFNNAVIGLRKYFLFTIVLVTSSMLATYVASGTPRVQCLPDRFFIEVRTLNPFVGRIFSKGQSKRAGCMAVFNSNSSLVEVSFSLNECGMMRERKVRCL
uniref:ZP domain-containing protein n=1 Tax=Parascaris equorum TaxID=6256 RepID=A0A914RWA3_PAREQ